MQETWFVRPTTFTLFHPFLVVLKRLVIAVGPPIAVAIPTTGTNEFPTTANAFIPPQARGHQAIYLAALPAMLAQGLWPLLVTAPASPPMVAWLGSRR